MKTILILAVALFFIGYQGLHAQQRPRNLGLLSELVYVKNLSEIYMIAIMTDSSQREEVKQKAMLDYNDLRIQYDQIILSLEKDMYLKNNFKEFTCLDHAQKMKKTDTSMMHVRNKYLAVYAQKLHDAYLEFNMDVYEKLYPNSRAATVAGAKPKPSSVFKSYLGALLPADAGAVLALGTFIDKAIQEANAEQARKVGIICTMLDQMRLRTTSQLIADLTNSKTISVSETVNQTINKNPRQGVNGKGNK